MPSKTNKITPTLVVLGLLLTGAVISISVFYSEASLTKHVPWLASIEALLGFNQQPSSQSIAREILAKRLPPVLDFKTQETITVAVKPDTDTNALPATRQAIKTAKAKGVPTRIVFEKGKYRFDFPEDDHTSCLTLSDMSDVIIDGQGSEITITNPRRGFSSLTSSKNIIIKNFIVDYDPLPFSQGIIESVDPVSNSFTARSEKGFLPFHDPNLQDCIGILMDPKIPGRPKAGANNFYYTLSSEKKEEDLTQVTLKEKDSVRANFAVGDRYVQIGRHQEYRGDVGTMANTTNVTYQNVTAYAAPVSSYAGAGNSGLNLIQCKTIIKPGRWISANGDSVHLQSSPIGPWIEECVFEGQTDDVMNFYTLPIRITEKTNDKTYKIIFPNMSPSTRGTSPGDSLTLIDVKKHVVAGEAIVVAVDSDKDTVTLDRSFQELEKNLDDYRFYNHNRAANYFVIRNNTFKNCRGHGLFLKSSYGLIEGNSFEGISSCSLLILNLEVHGLYGGEGFATDNLVVRGNTFKDSGYDRNYGGRGDIFVGSGGDKESLIHHNLFFENNRIEGWQGHAFRIGNAGNVHITNNTLSNSRPSSPVLAPITVSNASDVSIKSNTIVDPVPFENLVQQDGQISDLKVSGNTLNGKPFQ